MAGTRPLSPSGLIIATGVFLDTLPYDPVEISSRLGVRGHAPASRGPARTPKRGYVRRAGPGAYVHGRDATPERRGRLIHEFTHVWQRHHESHLTEAFFGIPMIVAGRFMADGIAEHLFDVFGVDPCARGSAPLP